MEKLLKQSSTWNRPLDVTCQSGSQHGGRQRWISEMTSYVNQIVFWWGKAYKAQLTIGLLILALQYASNIFLQQAQSLIWGKQVAPPIVNFEPMN